MSQSVCIDFQKNKCYRGESCKYQHTLASGTTGGVSGGTTGNYSSSYGTYGGSSDGTSAGAASSDPNAYYAQAAQQYNNASAAHVAAYSAAYGTNAYTQQGAATGYPTPMYQTASVGATSYPPIAPTTYSQPYSAYGGGYQAPSYTAPSYSSYYSSSSPPSTSNQNVCRDYRLNRCTRGTMCRYAHTDASTSYGGASSGDYTSNYGAKTELCGDFLKGRCTRGAMCRYSHDKGSGPPCRDFLKQMCTRGDSCRYSHYDAQTLPPCRDYQRGRCDRVNDCKYAHDRNDQTAAQVMLQSIASYPPAVLMSNTATPQDSAAAMAAATAAAMTAPTGSVAFTAPNGATIYPPQFATAQYGGMASGVDATYGGGAMTGYGNGYGFGYGAEKSDTNNESAPTDASMPSSSRKRAREDSDTNENGGSAEDEARLQGTNTLDGESGERKEGSDERPTKHQKTHNEEEGRSASSADADSAAAPPDESTLLASASRGADGRPRSGSIEGVEGGLSESDLHSSVASHGGVIDAGTRSAATAPANSAPSSNGPHGDGSGAGSSGPAGVGV